MDYYWLSIDFGLFLFKSNKHQVYKKKAYDAILMKKSDVQYICGFTLALRM